MLNTNYTENSRRIIEGKDVKSEIYFQKNKNNNSAKLYDCRIYRKSEVQTPMSRNFHTPLRYIGKSLCTFSLIFCNGKAWQNNSLKNSRCNHYHSNIPIDIKISLLQFFQHFLSLHFAVKFLYLSYQLSGRLKTSAMEQRNDDINNGKSGKNPHNCFEKIRPEC